MKQADIKILNRIKLNAENAVITIESLQEKVYEKELNDWMTAKNIAYLGMKAKAMDRLAASKAVIMNQNAIEEFRMKSGIFLDTVFNISTGHIADLLLKGNSGRIAKLWHELNVSTDFSPETAELANELTELENHSIEELRRFL